MGALVKSLMALFSAIIVFSTIILFLQGRTTGEDAWGLVLGWGIFASIWLVFWNYRGIMIQIEEGKLIVRYGLFNKKKFLLDEVESINVIKASFNRYFGIGVRYGFDGSVAYTTSFGDAVQIVTRRGEKFVFSTNKPDLVCETLRHGLSK